MPASFIAAFSAPVMARFAFSVSVTRSEETGVALDGPFLALTPVRLPSGKIVSAWACEGDLDPAQLRSNTFSIEWPPKSGVMQSFPEVDRGAWYSLAQAGVKLSPGQRPLLQAIAGL